MAQFMRFFDLPWKRNLRRAYQVIQRDGFPAFIRKSVRVLLDLAYLGTYRRWTALYDTLDRKTRQCIATNIARLSSGPAISIIMPVSGDDAKRLDGTIRSVQSQLYPRWELCIAVNGLVPESPSINLRTLARQDSRIRIVRFENSTTWAGMANAA